MTFCRLCQWVPWAFCCFSGKADPSDLPSVLSVSRIGAFPYYSPRLTLKQPQDFFKKGLGEVFNRMTSWGMPESVRIQ